MHSAYCFLVIPQCWSTNTCLFPISIYYSKRWLHIVLFILIWSVCFLTVDFFVVFWVLCMQTILRLCALKMYSRSQRFVFLLFKHCPLQNVSYLFSLKENCSIYWKKMKEQSIHFPLPPSTPTLHFLQSPVCSLYLWAWLVSFHLIFVFLIYLTS